MTPKAQYEIESLWIENRLEVTHHFADLVRLRSGEHLGETLAIDFFFVKEHGFAKLVEVGHRETVETVPSIMTNTFIPG